MPLHGSLDCCDLRKAQLSVNRDETRNGRTSCFSRVLTLNIWVTRGLLLYFKLLQFWYYDRKKYLKSQQFLYEYTCPYWQQTVKAPFSSFLPELCIKLSLSSLSNPHCPKQQNMPAIPTAFFNLLHGKNNLVFTNFFHRDTNNLWTGTKRLLNTYISSYLRTIIFPGWKVLYRSACISKKLLRLLCKAPCLQTAWGLPRRMNGILISSNYISITKTIHAAREKRFVLASVLHKTYALSAKNRL